MITNFEEITADLDSHELKLVSQLIAGFRNRTKLNPIKAPEIIKRVNEFRHNQKPKLTEPRLRKLVNYIRSNGLLPLIATSEGYYTSNDRDEIMKQIQSLKERAEAILSAANGLQNYLNQ